MTSTQIIDGKNIAEQILEQLKSKIVKLPRKPKLAIILLGNESASLIYVKMKVQQAHKIGIQASLLEFPSTISEQELISEIDKLNNDPLIDGIIVQLPIPKHIYLHKIIEKIDAKKDVDGLHPMNIGRLHLSKTGSNLEERFFGFVPCTALACLTAINFAEKNLSGKNVVIVNRSNLVGKPLLALLIKQNATVSMCHSASVNLHQITSRADIVVCAIGKAKFFNKSYFKKGAIIIDVGISRQEGSSKIYGDVDFEDLYGHASYITPVPGGIGPLTVAYLLSNTLSAASRSLQGDNNTP